MWVSNIHPKILQQHNNILLIRVFSQKLKFFKICFEFELWVVDRYSFVASNKICVSKKAVLCRGVEIILWAYFINAVLFLIQNSSN